MDFAPKVTIIYSMIYSVTVKPGSKKGPLVLQNDKQLTVYLREKPIDGAANTALVKLLSQHFDVAKSCIVIKSGMSSRQKLVDVVQ